MAAPQIPNSLRFPSGFDKRTGVRFEVKVADFFWCGEMRCLQGYFTKTVCRTWCFCGEHVVECVANVVILTVVFRWRKTGHPLELYFRLGLLESETAVRVRGG
jgi:hypothetical protein